MKSVLDYIGIGKENATKRSHLQLVTGLPDRALRLAIAYEVDKGIPIVNLQDGRGYYIATDADDVEQNAKQELSRGKNSIKHGRALFKAAQKIRREENQCQIL